MYMSDQMCIYLRMHVYISGNCREFVTSLNNYPIVILSDCLYVCMHAHCF